MIAQKRGKNVAIAGAVLQAVFAGGALLLQQWTHSLGAATWVVLLAAGVPLWLMSAVLFYCKQLERQETLELEHLAATGGAAGALFQQNQSEEFRSAASHVKFIEKWIVPIFTLLWTGLLAAAAVYMFWRLQPFHSTDLPNTDRAWMFVILIGFPAFLFSRYCTGMSRRPEWRPLRACGSYLLLCAIAAAVVAVGMLMESQEYREMDVYAAYVAPVMLLVLSAELLLNLVLDFFRPRMAGQEQRLSCDSRLCGLLAEPAAIGRSLAEAINYQFGFEVSKTWFYQLISRAIVPLVLFGVAVMIALTSIVVVRDGERCIVKHYGKRVSGSLGPGVHFTWPWPVDSVDRFNVAKVHEIRLGVSGERDSNERKEDFVNGREVFLWTKAHGEFKEQDFLVAVSPRDRQLAGPTAASAPATTQPAQAAGRQHLPPPVNIIKLVASVQYRIDDPEKFGYRYTAPAQLMECVACSEMTQYCASATLDEPVTGANDRPEAIMTFGQQKAAAKLKQRIEKAIGPEGLDLGVTIVNVDFLAVHPPTDAAKDYEAVLEAERRIDEKRFEAEAEAGKTLSQVAGDPQTALELALAIQVSSRLDSLRNLADNPSSLCQRLEDYIHATEKGMKALDDEIARERLSGRLGGGEETTPVYLRGKYAAHLEALQAMLGAARKGQNLNLASQLSDARTQADKLLGRCSGEAAVSLVAAIAGRWKTELNERVRAEAFQRKVIAFNASPRLYKLERWLDVWDSVLPDITKYVIGVDPQRLEIRMNLEEPPPVAGMSTFGTAESAKQK